MSADDLTHGQESWAFRNPVSVRFGVGCWRGAGRNLFNKKLLLLTTTGMVRRGVAAAVRDGWNGDAEITVCERVTPNPDIEEVDTLGGDLSGQGFDGIVALGGGSAIDTAKALAFLLPRQGASLGRTLRMDEPLHDGENSNLPVYAIPTTAGTGSEVTPFATIWDRRAAKKFSLMSRGLFPQAAFLDPELTYDLPFELAVSAGLDALSHALESVWNINATPITLALATRAAGMALNALPNLRTSHPSPRTRHDLLLASLLSGIAISQTRTALAHAMSYPLTAHYRLPHGLACSFTLPAVLEFAAAADDGRLEQFAFATGSGSTANLRSRLIALFDALEVDRLLRKHRVGGAEIRAVESEMLHPARANNTMRRVAPVDIRRLLETVGEYLPTCQLSFGHAS